jgi:hypothetical protein
MRSIRRSRSTAGLLAIAFLVAASACGADPPDQLTLPAPSDATDVADEPEATEEPDATDATDEPDATWAPTVEAAPEAPSLVTSTAVAVSAPFEAMVEASQYSPVRWLVPWDDGFLALGIEYPAQPLPEQLPPEVAELFPPEVVALFPDGLPPTQQEAMDILNEAGLFDVVMDVLDENPEAMDAVQSAPRPAPELMASWSTDGDLWIPTEIAVPIDIGDVSHVGVSGDRLTLAGVVRPPAAGDPWVVAIASTRDLENWNTASMRVEDSAGPSELDQSWVAPIAAAADDEHWVARVMIDMGNSMSGSGYSELREELWSAAWDGEPAVSETDQQSWILLATSDGFLDLGRQVAFSPDGQSWTEATEPAPNVTIETAAPFGDGVLALAVTEEGQSSILVLDATGNTVTSVEVPELGDGFSAWNSSSSPAFIVQTRRPAATEQPDLWLLATVNGTTWLLHDLDEGDPDEYNPPMLAAVNGTTVLTGTIGWEPGTDVWQRFTITE